MKTTLLAAVFLPLATLAQPWTPPPGQVTPSPVYEVRAAAPVPVLPGRGRSDDLRDLWSVEGTLAQLDRAAATRDFRLLRWVDGRAWRLLQDELSESRNEAERARLAGDGWRFRRASGKFGEVSRLEEGYRNVSWRLDSWSVSRRRAILLELDRLNRRELAFR